MGCGTSVAVQANAKQKADSVAVDEKQKKLVLRNWKYLSDDLLGRGTRIFLRIFEQNPKVKNLFPCREKEGDALTRDPHFKGHASRFMQAVGAVVDNIHDYEAALTPLLNSLGRQHIHFVGFKPDYFDAFEEAIMHVWSQDLGMRFTVAARLAWHRVLVFLMQELKRGYSDALRDSGLDKPYWEIEAEKKAREEEMNTDKIQLKGDNILTIQT